MAGTLVGTKKPAPRGGAAAPKLVVPFVRAAHEYDGDIFFDQVVTPVAGRAQKLTPQPQVPMYGFFRNAYILVQGSGGNLKGDVITQDFPFNIFESVGLTFPNGKDIVFPIDGFQLYLVNAFGGYVWSSDPTQAPGYSGAYANPAFMLRLPGAITPWDAFGALSNQNSGSLYKINVQLSDPATWSTGGNNPTPPNLHIQMGLEAWSAPLPTDMLGNAQQTNPPGFGSVQYWSAEEFPLTAGSNTPRTQRTGNLVRNWIFTHYDANGVRSNANLPDPFSLFWDTAPLINSSPLEYRSIRAFEQFNIAPPAGVVVYTRTDDQDGHAGYENRHLWLPTLETARIYLQGIFGAGTLKWLTNDVAITAAGR